MPYYYRRTPVGATLRQIARRLFRVPAKPRHEITSDVWIVSRWLGTDPETLLQFRGKGRDPRYHYRPLSREKRDGSRRQIYAPSPPLKALQRALLRAYLNTLYVHPAATGFRRGMGVADNARRHLRQALVITADLEDFFDNTSAQRVRDYFREQGWDEVVAGALTGLCTFRGALPQGAPTSPALSNLVNVTLDEALHALVCRSGGTYTRYGDDLTFSWPTHRAPAGLKASVQRIVMAHGYRLHRRKGWRVQRARQRWGREDRPRVTGIELGRDGQLHPTREMRREMRQLQRQGDDPKAQARLNGYRGFLKTLER